MVRTTSRGNPGRTWLATYRKTESGSSIDDTRRSQERLDASCEVLRFGKAKLEKIMVFLNPWRQGTATIYEKRMPPQWQVATPKWTECELEGTGPGAVRQAISPKVQKLLSVRASIPTTKVQNPI